MQDYCPTLQNQSRSSKLNHNRVEALVSDDLAALSNHASMYLRSPQRVITLKYIVKNMIMTKV